MVRSYRFVIVVIVTSIVLRRTIKAKINHVIKTFKTKTDVKFKNKFNRPTMDQLMNVILTIDKVHTATLFISYTCSLKFFCFNLQFTALVPLL